MKVYINNTQVKTFLNVQDALTTPLSFEFSRKINSSDVIKVAFTNDYNGGKGVVTTLPFYR